MKIRLIVLVLIVLGFLFSYTPVRSYIDKKEQARAEQERKVQLQSDVRTFLESKNSPLAPETEFLMEHKHWKLLIAISAIESQYCTRKIAHNCWGIGGDSAYKHYESIREAITDADALITHWQDRGRWLTIDDMNCHYVVPCNPNWVYVVNNVLDKLETYDRPATIEPAP